MRGDDVSAGKGVLSMATTDGGCRPRGRARLALTRAHWRSSWSGGRKDATGRSPPGRRETLGAAIADPTGRDPWGRGAREDGGNVARTMLPRRRKPSAEARPRAPAPKGDMLTRVQVDARSVARRAPSRDARQSLLTRAARRKELAGRAPSPRTPHAGRGRDEQAAENEPTRCPLTRLARPAPRRPPARGAQASSSRRPAASTRRPSSGARLGRRGGPRLFTVGACGGLGGRGSAWSAPGTPRPDGVSASRPPLGTTSVRR